MQGDKTRILENCKDIGMLLMHQQRVNLKFDILDQQLNTTSWKATTGKLSARKTNQKPQQQKLSARHTI